MSCWPSWEESLPDAARAGTIRSSTGTAVLSEPPIGGSRSEGYAPSGPPPLGVWQPNREGGILLRMGVRSAQTADLLWEALERPAAATRASPARVVLADDHPLFRDGLSRAISSHLGLELVGEATDGPGALALIEELEPDVALLDVKMPHLDGIEVCARVTRRTPVNRTRVVLLSAYLDPSLVLAGGLRPRGRLPEQRGHAGRHLRRARRRVARRDCLRLGGRRRPPRGARAALRTLAS